MTDTVEAWVTERLPADRDLALDEITELATEPGQERGRCIGGGPATSIHLYSPAV